MDDFRRRPVQPPAPRPQGQVQPTQQVEPPTLHEPQQPQPIPVPPPQPMAPSGIGSLKPKHGLKKKLLWGGAGLLTLVLLALGGLAAWYFTQLGPVDASNKDLQVHTVASGSTPTMIAAALKEDGLIRNEKAFLWYAKLNGTESKLQAGTYRLSPSESTPEILGHLSKGTVDTFSVTFLPGATLQDNRKVLISAGYSEAEVDEALTATYDSPLFEGKPAGADLEGYIYGETYTFGTSTGVQDILKYVFSHYYEVIEENNLIEGFAAQDLSLYQGITLASIVQREASPGGDDMPQIAQVFYKRLSIGMQLGSDVTYQYIADKTGVPRDTNLDSPYNTRRYTGLPPGPIAAPGVKALKATANPADTDYLYFLSGDDDVTYYGSTLQEHEANIVNHCQKKCQII